MLKGSFRFVRLSTHLSRRVLLGPDPGPQDPAWWTSAEFQSYYFTSGAHSSPCAPDQTSGVGPPEVFKRPGRDRGADIGHQPLVEPNIMHGNEDGSKHLAREKKVPDRPARESPASITVAAGFDRARNRG